MNPSFGDRLRIRCMGPRDVDRVIEIARSLEQAPHWQRSAYLAALDPEAAPLRIALVAQDMETGAVQGFAVARLLAPQAELESIAVAAEGQRRGVARRIFMAMAEELRMALVTDVQLEVRASNSPALAFYRTLGFAMTGRRPGYYADPLEDAILMELRLA
ncbi:MAG: GNAT family N-acetyltransferase [Terracidiphilus sp.]|jgi:ribosomal-protein-alanine N-acetyltransferase